jgi:hypothetical protein
LLDYCYGRDVENLVVAGVVGRSIMAGACEEVGLAGKVGSCFQNWSFGDGSEWDVGEYYRWEEWRFCRMREEAEMRVVAAGGK